MAWLTEWTRRKSKVVNNLTISDYQIQLIVHKPGLGPDTSTDIYLGGYCRDDFTDLRIDINRIQYKLLGDSIIGNIAII